MEGPLIIPVCDGVYLKQMEECDATDIFLTIDSQRSYLGVWLPFVEFTKKQADSLEFIRLTNSNPIETREYTFVIHSGGKFAGLIGFKSSDKSNKRTEIGYWLSEPFQGKGIMTRSVKTLMKFAFQDLGMHRIQIKCATGNQKSRNIPEKIGYKLEGTERDGELLTGGIFTDIAVYSFLSDDTY